MNDRKLNFFLLAISVVLTGSLLHAAYTYNQWREFAVSEFVVVVTALALSKLLREEA
ncbi:MAG: hypothetical protein KDD66_09925 [Bdellovibrionales bacterium]|nr:hypothetical protein [Bdellovibrionales bacterium]